MKKAILLFTISLSSFCFSQLTLVKQLTNEEIPAFDEVLQKQIFNGKMYYFGKNTSTQNCRIYVTDGTASGTVLLKDLGAIYTTGSGNYSITGEFNQTSDRLFFTRSQHLNPSTGGTPTEITSELWATDGTSAGTVKLLTKTNPIAGYSSAFPMVLFGDSYGTHPENLNYVGNKLIFTAYDPDNATINYTNQIAWVSDGTVAGTQPLLTNTGEKIYGGSGGGTKMNGKYYFGGRSQLTVNPGGFLYETDGTPSGTKKINPSASNWYVGSTFSEPLNGKFLFWATDNLGTWPQSNYEIWQSDGTAAGTSLFYETLPGMDSKKPYYGNALDFVNDGQKLYFMLQPDPANNNSEEIWVTDITVSNTKKIRDAANYLTEEVRISNGKIYFQEFTLPSGSSSQRRLSYSDGTVSGTFPVLSKNTAYQSMEIYNGALYFKDYDQMVPYLSTQVQDNMELWRSDGTVLNTGRVLDIYPGSQTVLTYTISNSSKPRDFFVLGNSLYFVADNAGGVKNLYKFTGDYTFNNSVNNSWNNPTNWNAGALPGATDPVNIPSGFPVTVNGNAFAGNLNLNSPLNVSAGNMNIGGNLNLGSSVTLNNNNLNLIGSNSQISNGNSTNYIITNGTGTVNVENLNSAKGTVNLPIGTATNYNPVSIANNGTSDTFSVKVSDGISNTTNGAVNATWDIAETTAGGSNVNVTLGWNASQQNGTFSLADAKVGHFVNGAWTEENSGSVTGSGPYTISATGISSFSPFAVMNFTALGTVDFSKSEHAVYPNPFTEILNVDVKENAAISIFDLSGKLVLIHILKKGRNEINKAELQRGVYVYQVKNTKGEVISFGKIIKK